MTHQTIVVVNTCIFL